MFKSLVKAMDVNHRGRVIEMMAMRPKSKVQEGFGQDRFAVARAVLEDRCRNFRPVMQIGNQVVEARFDKLGVSPQGRIVAYYSGHATARGVRVVQTARYRVTDAGFTLEHIFPLRVK